jgi:hypothetical protein
MVKKVTIGPSLAKKSAGQAKAILIKRYPSLKTEIDTAIEQCYGKDKGASKLEENDKTGTAESESPKPSKKG